MHITVLPNSSQFPYPSTSMWKIFSVCFPSSHTELTGRVISYSPSVSQQSGPGPAARAPGLGDGPLGNLHQRVTQQNTVGAMLMVSDRFRFSARLFLCNNHAWENASNSINDTYVSAFTAFLCVLLHRGGSYLNILSYWMNYVWWLWWSHQLIWLDSIHFISAMLNFNLSPVKLMSLASAWLNVQHWSKLRLLNILACWHVSTEGQSDIKNIDVDFWFCIWYANARVFGICIYAKVYTKHICVGKVAVSMMMSSV